jgi:hypothetical protein
VAYSSYSFCAFGFWFYDTGSCYIAQVGIQFEILLPQPPKSRNYGVGQRTQLDSPFFETNLQILFKVVPKNKMYLKSRLKKSPLRAGKIHLLFINLFQAGISQHSCSLKLVFSLSP